MLKSGLLSREIKKDCTEIIKDFTIATISNTGATALYITHGNVERKIPPFREDIQLPFMHNIPSDGFTVIEQLEISFRFEGGIGRAILDYRTIKDC